LTNGELDLSPADRDELLDTVRLELGRLTRLVENLLDLSRLQAGAAVPHFELWEVDELLARALADAPDSERVVCEVASAVPAALVDAGQVQRILANLIENALKFSPAEEPVEVRAWEHGDDVAIEVLDRGVGLDADEVSKLLEPFARGREVVRAPGAGLGLAIARGFADVNGGGLSLTPRIGGGTCARLVLRGRRLPAGIVSR
jgi:two-component system sensor histidine kinase KdpD